MNENKYSDYISMHFSILWMKKVNLKIQLQIYTNLKKFLSMHEYNKNISNI